MTDEIVITPKDIEAMAEAIISRAKAPVPLTKSGTLNILVASLFGPKHDWGFVLKNEAPELLSQRTASARQTEPRQQMTDPEINASHLLRETDTPVVDLIGIKTDPGDILGMPVFDESTHDVTFDVADTLLSVDLTKPISTFHSAQSHLHANEFIRTAAKKGLLALFGRASMLDQFLPMSAATPFLGKDESQQQARRSRSIFDMGPNTILVLRDIEKTEDRILAQIDEEIQLIFNAPAYEHRSIVFAVERPTIFEARVKANMPKTYSALKRAD